MDSTEGTNYVDDEPSLKVLSDAGSDSMEYEEESSNIRMQKAAARFLLTLKEQHRLTQVAINFLVAQEKQVMYCVVEDVRASVEQALLDNSTVSSTDQLQFLDKCYEGINLFVGLETEYKQTKFYKTHFNLVVC